MVVRHYPHEPVHYPKVMAKQHSPRFLAIVNQARTTINECTVSELTELVQAGAAVIDVREQHEFAAGHLKNAVHISKGVLERDIERQEFTTASKIILYCGGGYRSAIAARSLQDMGYQNVVSLWGGWRDILAAGLAIEK